MERLIAVSGLRQRAHSNRARIAGLNALIVITILLFVTANFAIADELLAKTRKPVFAGSFYPADRTLLEKMVDGYIKEAESKGERQSSSLIGVLAPHAGYEYSGKVAGYSYSRLKGKDYRTVVLIGPSHQVAFKGVSVYPAGAWETPLGRVEINQKAAQTLMENCKSIKIFPAAFEREHSLEVQLPFLQRTLKSFKIVPLVTGDMDANDLKSFSDALLKLIKQNPKETVIIASSDMSHFHTHSVASQMDRLTIKEIEALNTDKLLKGLYKEEYELCGANAVLSLMMTASKLNATAKTLRYANSGDVTIDRSRVVGYGSVAFYYSGDSSSLDKKQQEQLLMIARKTLDEHTSQGTTPFFEVKDTKLQEKRGAFVTLTKRGELRGCIGYIVPVAPLYKAVSEMAIAASTSDPRFPPVSKYELKEIQIEISALSPLKLINSTNEIEVGKHGLYITKGNYSGLLLPQVAVQYMWSREEFLNQTCHKAGLPPTAWKDKETSIYTFTAQIFSE